MDFYNQSLQKLRATLKAQETFQKSFKEPPPTVDTYDKLIALAASDFVKAYRQLKTGKDPELEVDEE